MGRRALGATAPAIALIGVMIVCAAAFDGDDVESAYRARFAALPSDDVAAHVELANWLHQQKAWTLLEKQCLYVLGLRPDHYNAGVLLREARQRIEEAREGSTQSPDVDSPAPAEPKAPAGLAKPPWLTMADVNRIRLGEYGLDGKAESVRVKFAAKPVEPSFESLIREAAESGRLIDPGWERTLRDGSDPERLQLILSATGLSQAARMTIESDPRLFRDFRKNVAPLIASGCARSGCHGGSTAQVFRLPTTGRRSTKYLYTLFYLLDRLETPRGRMLNRGLPDRSLLAEFMLPPDDADSDHPSVQGGYRGVVKGLKDRRYQEVVAWISRLQTPKPDYGIEYADPVWLKETSGVAAAAEAPEETP
ncbi:MAG: hypothetical protein KDA32_08775 [Phycisphaerales bacterium]|nr:hypothetical protein [Phycisphaerales bacterium]